MTKLALVLTVLAIILSAIHSGVSQKEDSSAQFENDQSQNQNQAEELEDGSDRVGKSQASANANAAAGGYGPRPGPLPPSPLKHECLACVGCPSPLNSTVKQCGYSLDPSKQRKCVLYGEKYHHMKEPWVIRGCASERGSCADIRASHQNRGEIVKLLYCRECEGDRCNDSNGAGIPHSLPDLFMAFLAMIVTPVITKYTMS